MREAWGVKRLLLPIILWLIASLEVIMTSSDFEQAVLSNVSEYHATVAAGHTL